ncbi:MAG: hypothetical protein U0R50_03350 [Gaiellales bacterium]
MRRPRAEAAGAIHHVVPTGLRRGPIVLDSRDRAVYRDRFFSIARTREWVVHTDCLLATHHHAVVETPNADLGVGMQRILGGYARWFNERHGFEGALFTGRFWSRRIVAAEQLLAACLYVDLNPVAAGLCRHPREWADGTYAHRPRAEQPTFLELLALLPGEGGDVPSVDYHDLIDLGSTGFAARHAANASEAWEQALGLAYTWFPRDAASSTARRPDGEQAPGSG